MLGIAVSESLFAASDFCRVALESNAFNTSDQHIISKIAFEKKEDLCSREYKNSEEFRSAARSGGFSVGFRGFDIGRSRGKSTSTGKVHFKESSFCQADEEQFSQEYKKHTKVKVADVALNAWRDCIEDTKKTSLWLEFEVPNDGTGMTGTISRTIAAGKTTLKITSMAVQPNDLQDSVSCTIEGRTFKKSELEKNPIVTDTVSEEVECTKPTDKTVRIAFGTDGNSLDWVKMPSLKKVKDNDIEDLKTEIQELSNQITADAETKLIQLGDTQIIWGRSSAAISAKTLAQVTAHFPTEFVNTDYALTATVQDYVGSAGWHVTAVSKSLDQVNITATGPFGVPGQSGNLIIDWVAIGRWK